VLITRPGSMAVESFSRRSERLETKKCEYVVDNVKKDKTRPKVTENVIGEYMALLERNVKLLDYQDIR
jgi:hypothetical protein